MASFDRHVLLLFYLPFSLFGTSLSRSVSIRHRPPRPLTLLRHFPVKTSYQPVRPLSNPPHRPLASHHLYLTTPALLRHQELHLSDGAVLRYGRLCICTGGRPRLSLPDRHPAVIGIRDGQSVDELLRRLGSARRVVVVGNGGIASELV